MSTHRARAVIAVLASGIAACHDGLKAPKGDPVPREAYIDSSVREICAALASCCSSRGFAFNAEACDSNVRRHRFQGADEICPGPALYDAFAAGSCLAEQKAALSSCALNPSRTSEACRNMCTGTVAVGQTCSNGTDCARGETGWGMCYPVSVETWTCHQYARGKAGDPCKAGFIQSPYGDCGAMASGWQNEGAQIACASEDGLYCALASEGKQPTCQPFLGPGQSCKESIRTVRRPPIGVDAVVGGQGLLCAPELYCNESQICVARKNEGAPCRYDEECINYVCGSASGRCLAAGVQDITADFCTDPV